jgi:hypothetical protein
MASHTTWTRTSKRKVTPAHSTIWSTRSCSPTAAALPRKIPAGSMPESRSPSRVPSPDSMATLR